MKLRSWKSASSENPDTRQRDREEAGRQVLVEQKSHAAIAIESAKLCGVEPTAYLTTAPRAALETPGAVTLPHALLTS